MLDLDLDLEAMRDPARATGNGGGGGGGDADLDELAGYMTFIADLGRSGYELVDPDGNEATADNTEVNRFVLNKGPNTNLTQLIRDVNEPSTVNDHPRLRTGSRAINGDPVINHGVEDHRLSFANDALSLNEHATSDLLGADQWTFAILLRVQDLQSTNGQTFIRFGSNIAIEMRFLASGDPTGTGDLRITFWEDGVGGESHDTAVENDDIVFVVATGDGTNLHLWLNSTTRADSLFGSLIVAGTQAARNIRWAGAITTDISYDWQAWWMGNSNNSDQSRHLELCQALADNFAARAAA